MLFFGVLGGELWFQAISNIVNRTRPAFKDPFETLIGPGYPSGHAATNVLLGWLVLYLLLPHIRSGGKRLLLVLAVIFVVAMVCISRLFLGLHYVTDIAGGLLLGFAWGGFIYTLIDVLHYRRHESAARAPGFQPAVIPVTTSEKKSED
jgi:undecaprenyl-diphosphatase